MEITREIIEKYSYSSYESINNYEKRTYKAMLEKVDMATLDKYNMRLATLWEFYRIPEDKIKNIHPISLVMNIKRLHFLPFYVFENMSIYQILVLSKPHLKRLPISILENWLKKYNETTLDIDILKDMQIPYSPKLIEFQKTLSSYIEQFKEHEYEMSKTKPEYFYLETNYIGIKDIDRFLFDKRAFKVPVSLNELFAPYKLMDDIYDYNKVLEYLNSMYPYKQLTKIEKMYSLGEIGALYAQTLYDKDIEILKYVSFLLETDDNIPKIQFSKMVFKYFYKDVVEYIEGRLQEKFNRNN